MYEILSYPVLSMDSPSNDLWVRHAAQDIQSVFCSSGCPLGSYGGSTRCTYFRHKWGTKNKKMVWLQSSQLQNKTCTISLVIFWGGYVEQRHGKDGDCCSNLNWIISVFIPAAWSILVNQSWWVWSHGLANSRSCLEFQDVLGDWVDQKNPTVWLIRALSNSHL